MTFTTSSPHDVRAIQQRLNENYSTDHRDDRLRNCDVGSCLTPLLEALGWRGEVRHLMEALPHLDAIDSLDALRAVLSRLNFETHRRPLTLSSVKPGMLPCLFENRDGEVFVLLEREGTQLHAYAANGRSRTVIPADATSGTAHLVTATAMEDQQQRLQKHGWISILVSKFRKLLWQLMAISFVINLFALAVPLYTMNVYDKVVGAQSSSTLVYFLLGICIIVAADVALRMIRARAMAYLGARCEALIGAVSFQHLLNLPINMTERAAIGSQITRIKQFESIRDIFSGSIASTALDIPFVIVFLAAIVMISGHVAWVAAALIALYAIMAVITIPLTNMHVSASGEARSRLQNFLIELLSKQNAVRRNKGEDVWQHRFRHLLGATTMNQFRAQQLSLVIQTLSQSLVMAAGVATVWIGTLLVMEGELSVGGLIAVMTLVWRVLSPLNAAFLTLNRLSQVAQTFKQINALMRLKLERVPGQLPSFYRSFNGSITLSRVGFRYSSKAEPALMGATLSIAPGQFVCITGPSGGGKSTLLKVIAGLYQPQAGAVLIDGLDARQLDMGELRNAISVVPQTATLFHGTVDQNIRLAHPSASDAELEQVCRELRLDDYAETLSQWRETRLTTEVQRKMPGGLKQRLMLARAFIKDAPIVLLDEPANHLDPAGEQALIERLKSLHGRATIIMVTHRPSHMRLADRLVYMENGQIVHDAAPEQVLPLILDAA